MPARCYFAYAAEPEASAFIKGLQFVNECAPDLHGLFWIPGNAMSSLEDPRMLVVYLTDADRSEEVTTCPKVCTLHTRSGSRSTEPTRYEGDAMFDVAAKRIGIMEVTPVSPLLGSAPKSQSIEVTLTLKIDLRLLRRQKRALIGIRQDAQICADQEEAAEGMLSLIDFIQDSIFEQGLAAEEEIFPQMSFSFADAA